MESSSSKNTSVVSSSVVHFVFLTVWICPCMFMTLFLYLSGHDLCHMIPLWPYVCFLFFRMLHLCCRVVAEPFCGAGSSAGRQPWVWTPPHHYEAVQGIKTSISGKHTYGTHNMLALMYVFQCEILCGPPQWDIKKKNIINLKFVIFLHMRQ